AVEAPGPDDDPGADIQHRGDLLQPEPGLGDLLPATGGPAGAGPGGGPAEDRAPGARGPSGAGARPPAAERLGLCAAARREAVLQPPAGGQDAAGPGVADEHADRRPEPGGQGLLGQPG